MANKKQTDDLIDRDTAAEILGVHPKTIERYVRQGRLPAYKVGPREVIRFRKAEIEEIRDRVIPA